jgi:four helix bundle protein
MSRTKQSDLTVRQFEDLAAWQKARALTRTIYEVTRGESFAQDYALSSQMRHSAIAIMSCIGEGFERRGQNEYLQYMFTARMNCAELRSQLYVGLDAGFFEQAQFQQVFLMINELARILGEMLNASNGRLRPDIEGVRL